MFLFPEDMVTHEFLYEKLCEIYIFDSVKGEHKKNS